MQLLDADRDSDTLPAWVVSWLLWILVRILAAAACEMILGPRITFEDSLCCYLLLLAAPVTPANYFESRFGWRQTIGIGTGIALCELIISPPQRQWSFFFLQPARGEAGVHILNPFAHAKGL